MELAELLRMRGLDVEKTRTKIVRHVASDYDVTLIWQAGFLGRYEAVQSQPVFNGCDFVVSCLGEEGMRSRVVRVARVDGLDAPMRSWPDGFPLPNLKFGDFNYKLVDCPEFGDLVDRVVVDWGKSPRAWHQWLKCSDKPVIEVLPKGFVKRFTGYDEVLLSHRELVEIIDAPDANRDWRERLERVGGVYLIVDQDSAKQYIGSATGAGGIWARWCQYAKTGHGGNRRLQELMAADSNSATRFTYSILRVVPQSTSRDEVLALEKQFKAKLGTRATGLNAN